MLLLAAMARNDTRLADMVYDYTMSRIIREHDWGERVALQILV